MGIRTPTKECHYCGRLKDPSRRDYNGVYCDTCHDERMRAAYRHLHLGLSLVGWKTNAGYYMKATWEPLPSLVDMMPHGTPRLDYADLCWEEIPYGTIDVWDTCDYDPENP